MYYVNQSQTRSERKAKYRIALKIGLSKDWARRIRDFSEYHFELFVKNYIEMNLIGG